MLNALASAVPTGELAATVRQTLHGRYMRRLWFMFEWLTGSTLDVPDIGSKQAIVPALEPNQQCVLVRGENSPRHRVPD